MRQTKCLRALVVRPRPIISGIRPPARIHQSARRFSVRRSPAVRRFRVTHFTFVRVNVNHVAHVQVRTSTSIGSAPASSIVLKKMGEFYRRGTNHRRVCSAHVEYHAHKPQNGVSGGFTRRTRTHKSPTYASGKPFCCRASICLIDQQHLAGLAQYLHGRFSASPRVQWDIRA